MNEIEVLKPRIKLKFKVNDLTTEQMKSICSNFIDYKCPLKTKSKECPLNDSGYKYCYKELRERMEIVSVSISKDLL